MTYLLRPSDPGELTFWTNQFVFGGQTNEDLITGSWLPTSTFNAAFRGISSLAA
jgi:hypothetical protein